jgi:hypothetical protein
MKIQKYKTSLYILLAKLVVILNKKILSKIWLYNNYDKSFLKINNLFLYFGELLETCCQKKKKKKLTTK